MFSLRRPLASAPNRWSASPPLLVALSLASIAAAGCGLARRDEPLGPSTWASEQGAPIDLLTTSEFEEIALLEDARTTGNGRLIQLLTATDPRARRRATIALGRLPYPEHGRRVTEALTRALEDPGVQLDAAFGLGLRADPSSAGVLAAYRNDADPAMRARIVEAAGRVPSPGLHDEVVVSLRDSDLAVQIEAAVATARWDPEGEPGDPNPAAVDRALLDALRPYKITPAHETTPAAFSPASFSWAPCAQALGQGRYRFAGTAFRGCRQPRQLRPWRQTGSH